MNLLAIARLLNLVAVMVSVEEPRLSSPKFQHSGSFGKRAFYEFDGCNGFWCLDLDDPY